MQKVDNWRSLFLRGDSGDSIDHLNYYSTHLRTEVPISGFGDYRLLLN